MEMKLEDLISEIKFYKSDKKMETTFKEAEHKCIKKKKEDVIFYLILYNFFKLFELFLIK